MVLILAVESFIATCFPLKKIFISLHQARAMVACGWLVSLTIAILPVVELYLNSQGFNNSMCVLLLCFDRLSSWVIAVIYVINTIISIVNVFLYASIIIAVYGLPPSCLF